MNTMNDDRFFDLAMKVIANQAADAERAELEALVAARPELEAELARLRSEAAVVKEALPLVEATEATAGKVPAYARGRLQTKVRQTLGRPQQADEPKEARERSSMWTWRWALGLAAATAVVLVVLIPTMRTLSEPVIQIAMLDLGGATRGSDTNEVALLGQTWSNAAVASFTAADELHPWETNWPAGNTTAIKIVYDRAAGEVRVLSWQQGKVQENVFPVERDLATTLKAVKEYIATPAKK